MAVNGLFTYEDLYAGRSSNRKLVLPLQTSSSSSYIVNQFLPRPDILTTPSTSQQSYSARLASLPEEIQSSTKSNRFDEVIPFTYFYWLLVLLAILLTLTLITVFICYCRTFVKNYQARRASLASFQRYRTANRRVYTQNRYQSTVPPSAPLLSLPTPPCPSKSLECLSNRLQRQDLDLVISPPTARLDLYQTEPMSTFTSSTSNLPSALQSRLSVRSSDPPLKIEQIYESQRACMALDDGDD